MLLSLHLPPSLSSSTTSPLLQSPFPQSRFFSSLHTNTTLTTKRRQQTRTRAESLPPESAIGRFWKWMGERGAVPANSPNPLVRPGIVPEGLGLVAQRDIPRNEVVVEVPKQLWINSDTALASEIGGVCAGLKPWLSIALFLLREKGRGEDSPWKPYLDVLPEATDSTLFWSDEELSELQGTQLLNTTLGVREYVKSEFLKIEEVILLNKHLFLSPITLKDLLWAFGMIRSRALTRLHGENLVLIPLVDLINHDSSINTEESFWEIKGKGLFSREFLFSLRAPAYVKAGDQVCIQYDLGKSNAEFALDYGFIETRANRNTYTLTLEIAESDPFFGDKLDIAESNGLGEIAYFDIILGESLPPQMIPYLRLVALGGTDAFLLESIFRNSVWGHLELPVSRSNEELICKVIREACRSASSAYQTSIKEDERLMEMGNLEPRLGIAVGIRVGEKKVLQQIDMIFQDRELELDVLEYYQERRLKDLGLVGEQGDIIFWETK